MAECYDHGIPLELRMDCLNCSHPAVDHPVDLGGREAISFACLRRHCECRNYRCDLAQEHT